MFEFLSTVRSRQHRKAWFVAIMADAIQIIGFPLFFEGGISPADTVLDFITGALLTKILGWHWAFVPTFAAELVPGLDLFPTWTAAVFFVTRTQVRTVEPEILRPGTVPPQRSN
jgi:hypothetical protein